MRYRPILVAAVLASAGMACGSDEPAATPEPTPAVSATPYGIDAPAERARNTVDDLNEQTRQRETETGYR